MPESYAAVMAADGSENPPWKDLPDSTPSVLVVDDSEFFADMMASEIENGSSFETISCYDGETALEKIERNDIACIVSDYRMDPVDGIELLETVRDEYGAIPFIILTGQGGEEVAIEAIRLGATDYVTKEMIIEGEEFSLLLNRIEQSVNHTMAQTELARRKELIETQRDNLEFLNEVLRHDIRNDLQIISAYADRLEDHVDQAGRADLETIQQSTDNAIELTKTTDKVAEIMLRQEVDRQAVSIRDIITEEIETIRAADPNATVEVVGEIPDVEVLAGQMIDAVFRNLLKNAVQHNDKREPEITVSATEQEEVLEVRVADNGPGISEELQQSIFGKGERGLESEGTGIGLHLVATLVDDYDGDVRIEDNDPEGSVFVVELQLADA
ncbi:receiver box histidine kinase [Natronomonas pharaonis DSM 2160]|uniref:Receiver box histidine kinase n=1 Tax=Natronomonas pharaonis (strain ATCC 35678 / DSM 2160 / CIP 103997 / JCM 8858 / NBRC 14720 / NCIMB 2260 / Gabara) TaxID=348780 RepID=A0A1U7EXD8_NATPD|nr:hybrid sensor histidine kinase/response regulator [Natronomonas pharaonis]CAI49820.1 receiver box histidine kinase [Natronomonas pharaonis DSM 2160]